MKKYISIILIAFAILSLPPAAFAQIDCNDKTAADSTALCNGLSGVTDVNTFLSMVFAAVGEIIGLAAIVMVVYSGFRMLVAQGDPEGLKTAKAGFSWAIIGFVVSIISFVIMVAVQNFIGFDASRVSPGKITNPLASDSVQELMGDILVSFMGFLGALASVMIVVNAYRYITSAGNEEQLKKAKTGLLWSVVGFLTAILAFVIISAVNNLLG